MNLGIPMCPCGPSLDLLMQNSNIRQRSPEVFGRLKVVSFKYMVNMSNI